MNCIQHYVHGVSELNCVEKILTCFFDLSVDMHARFKLFPANNITAMKDQDLQAPQAGNYVEINFRRFAPEFFRAPLLCFLVPRGARDLPA